MKSNNSLIYLTYFSFLENGRMGEIVIELYWKHAPNTCRNFAELAKRSYYNNVKFHRIIRDFMIQGKKYIKNFYIAYFFYNSYPVNFFVFYLLIFFRVYNNKMGKFTFNLGGDPTGTGKGGSSIYGKKFNDEIHEDLKHTGNVQ